MPLCLFCQKVASSSEGRHHRSINHMHGPRKFCQRSHFGVFFINLFF